MHGWLIYVNIYKENNTEQNIIKNKKINEYILFHLFKTDPSDGFEQKFVFLWSLAPGNIRGAFNKFPDFFVPAFKIVVDTWKFRISYCYTSYEMTDQFLWLQLQMNSYNSN